MSYSINQNDMKMFANENFRETRMLFPKQKGFYSLKKEKITDDIVLFRNEVHANDDISIVCNNMDFNFFSNSFYIDVIISGSLQAVSQKINAELCYKKSFICPSVYFSPTSYNIQKNDFFSSIGFVVHETLLSDLKIDTNKRINILKNSPSNPKSTLLAKQILNSPFQGSLDKLYLQSKALEIVFLELSSLHVKPKNKEVKFSEYDINALYKAKQILETSSEFPSISKLSKMVCLNEFKLKYGFAKYFQDTPYQVSLKHRLHLAKKLLQKDHLSIAQISQKAGFKHQQGFSTAFTKYFSIRPKDMRKSKKFYYWFLANIKQDIKNNSPFKQWWKPCKKYLFLLTCKT